MIAEISIYTLGYLHAGGDRFFGLFTIDDIVCVAKFFFMLENNGVCYFSGIGMQFFVLVSHQ